MPDHTHTHDDHHHDAGHDHGHGHGHSHAPANFDRAFAIGVALNLGFVVIEAVYGLLANSLALLADAGHNLSDVAGLLLAWGRPGSAEAASGARYDAGQKATELVLALVDCRFIIGLAARKDHRFAVRLREALELRRLRMGCVVDAGLFQLR